MIDKDGPMRLRKKPKNRRNVTMAENRYVGSYPVIGIRPTIDGRKGALDVRGSSGRADNGYGEKTLRNCLRKT